MSVVRAQLRRVPVLAWLCAAAAFANGLAWTVIIPPFQVPDENAHVAYAQYFAETGRLPGPDSTREPYSQEERETLNALGFYLVIGQAANRPPVTPAETEAVREVERRGLDRVGSNATTASNNPPAYYVLEALPYWVSPSHDLLDRVWLMRLWSPLFAAITALAAFLFARELLPGSRWTWPVAGLAVAFEPMFGFMSGGVSADTMLYAVSATAMLLCARILRRGLTVRRGVVLGGVAALGVLTKLTFLALVPGIVLALALSLLQVRADPARRRVALRGALLACGILGAVAACYLIATHSFWERAAPLPGQPAVLAPDSLSQRLSFSWQLFLPRLPFMNDIQVGFPLQDVWASGVFGRFGWLDYGFPSWLYLWVWRIMLVLGALLLIGLVVRRDAVRRRFGEVLVYLTFGVGVLVAIAAADYSSWLKNGDRFLQGRYLLPLLALYGGFVALGVRTLGPRWGRVAGVLIVVATIAASLYAQILTLDRYYG